MIDFNKPVKEVHKKICGLSDWPCAVTTLDGKRLKVFRSQIVKDKMPGQQAGTVVDTKQFCVCCADGVIKLTEVQAEGSKRMRSEDYLRGKPITPGTILGVENKK
jgi:methionyl-tRNA formyltransferase